MITQHITDDEDGVLDLSVKKRLPILLSPPSSTTSSSSSSNGKRILDLNPSIQKVQPANKRPLRFQCKHCDYKAPSTSLMQNHIYRHTDLTPYACAYCGHKSTTKSTIMVHIELCHPNMEVKINENRVREQDFYRDLNSSEISINGVAISLKSIIDDGNELSPASDELYDIDNLEPILNNENHEQTIETSQFQLSPSLKLKFSPPPTPIINSSSTTKGSDSDG
jgi:hypothetical protein